MPSTGMPSSSKSFRSFGAPSAYTDAGPPERIRPRGLRRLMSSTSTVCGSSSEKTPSSRTRRAISCEYWPPKSRTSTSSVADFRGSCAAAPSVARTELSKDAGLKAYFVRRRPRTQEGEGHRGRGLVRGDGLEDLLGVHAAHERLGRLRRRRGCARGPHPDRLLTLERLAFALQRRRDHHLGPL